MGWVLKTRHRKVEDPGMSMKCLLAAALVWVALTSPIDVTAVNWNSSFETARQQASANNRPILAVFTGSDWSPACMQLKTTILNSPEFQTIAEQRLILMEVDFPRTRPMAALHLQANQQLARTYNVTAFPTVLMISASGTNIAQISSSATKEQFLEAIAYLSEKATATPETPPPSRQLRPPSRPRELPLFGGAALQPIPTFTNLVVKSISGPAGRRFALINRETMTTGDVAWFGLSETNRIQVKCLEVRERSVLVRVHGEPNDRELVLSDIRKSSTLAGQ